jgi:peptidoglycan/LPS O-acetylase OafA/YrhL
VWSLFHNLSWSPITVHGHGINLNAPISIVGTGVDLFFVISGFCIYLMYVRKQDGFSWNSYGNFMRARWFRIAPAYYVTAVAAFIILPLTGTHERFYDLLTNLAFMQFFFMHTTNILPPFWSLAVEWNFYLLLPMFVFASRRWGFGRALIATACVSMLFRLGHYAVLPHVSAKVNSDVNYFVLDRLVEFCCGIFIAHLYTRKVPLPGLTTKTDHLPRGYSKTPNITFAGK